MEKQSFYYRCRMEVEILANREQEYIRRKKDEYESEFDDGIDFLDAKRWIKDITKSFYAKTEEEVIERFNFEFHNGRIDVEPIIEDGYFYWFDNNCLVNNERLLHRASIHVDYACDVELSEEDIKKIAIKRKKEVSAHE